LFLLTALFMLYSTLSYAGIGSILGIAVMVAGIPVLGISRGGRAVKQGEVQP
jgi:hypothetical protein